MEEGYGHDESLDDQQPTNPKAKLSDLNKSDLIELISHLEHEVHNRESIISEMMNQHTKQALYQAKYGRFGAADPFTALHRDSDKVTDDHFDHNQVKALFDNQLQQLENLIETQRRAQATMREQKLAADERYKKVCLELDEARKRHAKDTAQGDDVTVALEKEREKLHQDLAYAKNKIKKSDKDLKRTKSQLNHQAQLATKHKQVALDLIKERRKMVAKVSESEKRNQAIAQLLQKEQEDSKKSENSKLLQLEARMEKQLMDFDIEREQYKARIRKEEGKVKDLLLQLTDIKETVLSLQQDSSYSQFGSSQYIGGRESTDFASVPKGDNITPVSLIKSASERVITSQELRTRHSEPLTFTSTNHTAATETVKQSLRLDTVLSTSTPSKQSSNITKTSATEKTKSIHSPEISNKPKQSVTAVPVTTPKPGSPHVLQRPSDYRAISSTRPAYYKPSAVATLGEIDNTPAAPTSSPISVSTKPHQHIINRQSLSTKPANQEASPSLPPTVNTSIPIRMAMRNPATTANSAPPVSPKPVNTAAIKQSNYVANSNNSSNRPMVMSNTANRPIALSPRSATVPPHLSTVAPSTVDSKLINIAGWVNPNPGVSVSRLDSSSPRSSRPMSANLISPNEELLGTSAKAKPPPPVRNVSLPPTKKYQSIENTSS